jgi:hypothetical protein
MTRGAEVREPESYAGAAEDADWRAAMEEEMHALAENGTWDLVDAPAGRCEADRMRVDVQDQVQLRRHDQPIQGPVGSQGLRAKTLSQP